MINYSQNIAKTQLYNILPNFFVEALLFSLVIGFLIFSTVYLSFGLGNIGAGVPYVGVFFMALYKLKPAFQNILGGFSAIRVNLHSMENMLVELKSDFSVLSEQKSLFRETFPIVCKDVSYKYESRSDNALTDINLEILSSQSIAIIGKTGSGKSTFLDLFCGLLSPSCGGFSINHVGLNATNVNSFRSIVSYLPQSVFIAESTVTENIALGFDPQDLDLASVKRCAEQACIYDFIVNDLPDGFDTFLGENGCQLSGGQRQRIGLARALYRKPKILILDEGTSALDSHTENLVLKALINSSIEVVINVTHRLDTLDFFDRVLFFSDGHLIIDCDAKDFDKSSFSS